VLQEQLEQIKQQKPQKVIFKKVKSLESRNSAAKTIGSTVPDEICNLPGHSDPPIDYNKLSPERRRVVDAQNSAEKVAAIPKALLTGTRSFNIYKIEESADDTSQ
jgi:hypothetical protein